MYVKRWRISLTQASLFPTKSCVFEKTEKQIDKIDYCEDNTMVEDYKLQHVNCYLSPSLPTQSKNEDIPAVTPPYSKRERSITRVSWNKKVEYINDEVTVSLVSLVSLLSRVSLVILASLVGSS